MTRQRHIGVSLGFVLSSSGEVNTAAVERLPQGEIISLFVDASTIAMGQSSPQYVAQKIFTAAQVLHAAGLGVVHCHVSTFNPAASPVKIRAAQRTLRDAMIRLNEGKPSWWKIYIAERYRPPLAAMLTTSYVSEFWGATPTDRHTARAAGVAYFT
jgi:hypothetical protein